MKLSAVILSMQELLFSEDVKQRETGMPRFYRSFNTLLTRPSHVIYGCYSGKVEHRGIVAGRW